jgi:hypothetical protein
LVERRFAQTRTSEPSYEMSTLIKDPPVFGWCSP